MFDARHVCNVACNYGIKNECLNVVMQLCWSYGMLICLRDYMQKCLHNICKYLVFNISIINAKMITFKNANIIEIYVVVMQTNRQKYL